MTTSHGHNDELVEFATGELSSNDPVRRMFMHGVYDELIDASNEEELGPAYEAGRRLINELVNNEPLTPISALICHPNTVIEICSHFNR